MPEHNVCCSRWSAFATTVQLINSVDSPTWSAHPEVMQAQQVLRVEEYDADDREAVEAGYLILEAARAVDSPFLPPSTVFRRTMSVRYGWDRSPLRYLLARVDGRPVALADLELVEWDNRDLAWMYLVVDPAHRRLGYGSELMSHVVDLARQVGRTKFGGGAWETPAAEGFAAAHGFALASQEIYRAQAPRELPPGFLDEAYAEAAPHAGDYELVRIEGHAPEALLPAIAELTGAINDAPLDDLDIEDEVFPVERIRNYETATVDSGHRLYRVVARHRETGEPAGHTAVAVDTERPQLAHQHDTVRDARPPRSPARPAAEGRDGVAGSPRRSRRSPRSTPGTPSRNAHMIAINERLRYRALGRELEFQKR